MNPIKKDLLHLLSMTQSYLQNEIDSKASIWLAPESYSFYKDSAVAAKPQKAPVKFAATSSTPSSQTLKPLTPHLQIKTAPEPIIAPKIKESQTRKPEPSAAPPKEKINSGFTLEPVQEIEQRDYSEAKKIVQERFSRLAILPLPTFETLTSLAGNRALLVHNEKKPSHLTLLKNITKALIVHGCPSQLISASEFNSIQLPEELKLIIATADTAEKAKTKAHTLTLLPLEQYLENIPLKRELWTQLRQQLLNS